MTRARPTPGIDGRIFVVGVPRSGTTLVQSLLAAHGSATSFTESHFFDRHFTLLPLLARPVLTRDPAARVEEFLDENDEKPPAAAEWFAAGGRRAPLPLLTRRAALQLLRLLDELTLRRGVSTWIEKTPRHLRYLPFLERLPAPGPRPRFVHVIRDGLEVVASLHRASQSWQRPYDLETCARRWNADVGFSLRRAGAPGDRFVFYEELTARPEATLRRLLAELGLDWQPEILERYAETSRRLIAAQEEGWKPDVGRGIRRSATSQRTLTGEQRRRVGRSLRRGLYDRLHRRAERRAEGSGAG